MSEKCWQAKNQLAVLQQQKNRGQEAAEACLQLKTSHEKDETQSKNLLMIRVARKQKFSVFQSCSTKSGEFQ